MDGAAGVGGGLGWIELAGVRNRVATADGLLVNEHLSHPVWARDPDDHTFGGNFPIFAVFG